MGLGRLKILRPVVLCMEQINAALVAEGELEGLGLRVVEVDQLHPDHKASLEVGLGGQT